MRLIDADALKERIGKICDESKEGYERSDFVQSNMVMMALAKSSAYVGVPHWSKTTFNCGLVAVKLSIVLQKFLPNSEYSQAVRIIT